MNNGYVVDDDNAETKGLKCEVYDEESSAAQCEDNACAKCVCKQTESLMIIKNIESK